MKLKEAMKLFREMPLKGSTPNVFVYTTVLRGSFRMGMVNIARRVLQEMQVAGVSPDFHACCVLVDGLCKEWAC